MLLINGSPPADPFFQRSRGPRLRLAGSLPLDHPPTPATPGGSRTGGTVRRPGPVSVRRSDDTEADRFEVASLDPTPTRRPGLPLRWTPFPGPLDRGVFVKIIPHFNQGRATIPDQI